MRKTLSNLALTLLVTVCISNFSVYAEKATASDLEKAQMNYILAYEALQIAKKTPEQQGNIVQYIRYYRQAYAQYLQLLKNNDLYDPSNPERDFDPANDFNDSEVANNKKVHVWKSIDPRKYDEVIKNNISNCSSPNDLVTKVMSSLNEKDWSTTVDFSSTTSTNTPKDTLTENLNDIHKDNEESELTSNIILDENGELVGKISNKTNQRQDITNNTSNDQPNSNADPNYCEMSSNHHHKIRCTQPDDDEEDVFEKPQVFKCEACGMVFSGLY